MNILDNLSKKVAGTYKTAAKASGELLEETRLRLAIISEQNKIDELYEKLGDKVYSMYEEGESLGEKFDGDCEKIQEIKQRISSMKNRVKELRNVKTCTRCSTEVNLAYQYCPRCGEKLEMPPPPVETVDACPECNTEAAEQFDFCPECGKKKE